MKNRKPITTSSLRKRKSKSISKNVRIVSLEEYNRDVEAKKNSQLIIKKIDKMVF